ncbi:hypothetical protein BDR26DRAFT_852421 [Obelidium mucronatum]|nr:hypothetical protein BDR26DRAFT_852421 [Obelidium mucronatum]
MIHQRWELICRTYNFGLSIALSDRETKLFCIFLFGWRVFEDLVDWLLDEKQFSSSIKNMSAPNIVANESQMSHRFTDTYNPQSGRGRKPSNGSASSRRAEQNRIHQRTLRERKEAYVKGLNAKIEELTSLLVPNALFVEYERLKKRVSDLEMELSSTRSNLSDISKSPPECSNCAAERFKNAILTEKVSGLNRQLSDLKATKAPSPQPPAPSDLPPLEFIDPMMMDFSAISDDWMEALLRDIEQPRQLLKSAEELYGPLEVLSCGIAFKGIPYIKNSKMDIVDRLGLLLTV